LNEYVEREDTKTCLDPTICMTGYVHTFTEMINKPHHISRFQIVVQKLQAWTSAHTYLLTGCVETKCTVAY